jgi:thiamine-phosphate pyrophosphorylase
MRLHQPRRLPEFFFFTDEARRIDPLAAARSLPVGSGIVFRHYSVKNREELARKLAGIAKERRLVLLIAGDWKMAARVGANGVHWPEGLARHGTGVFGRRKWLVTVAAHSQAALNRARELKADAAFLSPLFPTPSHPEAKPLGILRFALMSRMAGVRVVALGGVSKAKSKEIRAANGIATASLISSSSRSKPKGRRESV